VDRIDLLETKVREMIGAVQSLRDENRELRRQLTEAQAQGQSLSSERELLDQERVVVRNRIEQLLGDLEGCQGSSQAEGSDAASNSASDPNQSAPHSVADAPLRAMDGGRPHGSEMPDQAHPGNPVLPGLA